MEVQRTGGLACSPVIRQLVDTEPQLREAIGDYLFERNDFHKIRFALPAPAEEMRKHRANRDSYKLMFPEIVLNLRRVKHHLTNEIGVEVTCSDDDERQVLRMFLETEERRIIAKQKTLM